MKQPRETRFCNGALRLDQKKLGFHLNPETMLPESIHLYEGRESNNLIEEFMLLANISVAHKIKDAFPDKVLLIYYYLFI